MQQPHPDGGRRFVAPSVSAPSFVLIKRQPLRPEVVLLAIAVAAGALFGVTYAMDHAKRKAAGKDDAKAARSADAASTRTPKDTDDPNQIDTIVLGDPADAPVPGRHGDHVSPVHPTIVVRLPRYGDDTGLIPATPAGHLLYAWLAAFNQASSADLLRALPNVSPALATAAQLELRKETGGFALISAREVQPGVLVFRLRDQTPAATEVLGTLQACADCTPAAIATLSLRAVTPPQPEAGARRAK